MSRLPDISLFKIGLATPMSSAVQLISIARAAAAQPKLLLLDEITANLDAETEKAVLRTLKKVAENRTVISISHRTFAEMGRIIALKKIIVR